MHGFYPGATLRAFEKTLCSFHPDVVHAHELYPLITPSISRYISRRNNIPTVMTCHDYRMTCPVYTHLRATRSMHALPEAGRNRLHSEQLWRSWPKIGYALRNFLARKFELFRSVSHFITPSDFVASWLTQHAGIPFYKITTLLNPIAKPKYILPYDPETSAH